MSSSRRLVVGPGDQLDPDSAVFDGFDPRRDRVWMAEVRAEATHVWSHKVRIGFFLAAMRHFRDALRERGVAVEYRELGAHPQSSLGTALAEDLRRVRPQRMVLAEPGDWRVREALGVAAGAAGVPLEMRPDRQFLCDQADFTHWASGRKLVRLEHPRAGMQWRNLARLDAATLARIQAQAARLRASLTETEPSARGSRP